MSKVITKIYSKKTIDELTKKINHLGSKYNYDVLKLINFRFYTSLIIFFTSLIILKFGILIAPIITFLYYYLTEYFFLEYRIKKRIKHLEEDAIMFFEVLLLALESGENLRNALNSTVDIVENDLSYEFQRALSEVKIGKSLTDSLKSMRERIPANNINTIILYLTDSNDLGISIKEAINNQIIYLNELKLNNVRGKIAKLPMQLSVISVLIFIPIILLIVLAPVIIKLLVG